MNRNGKGCLAMIVLLLYSLVSGSKARSVTDIRSVCLNSTLPGSLAVYGNRAENSRKDVEKWLKPIGITE